MRVKVMRKFRDKYTGEVYKKGDVLTITEARYNELKIKGQYVFEFTEKETEEPSDGFDAMTVRELREYADKTYKVQFASGTKKSEIIEILRRTERGK